MPDETIPSAPTSPDRYYAELGRFISIFSLVEGTLRLLLAKRAKLSRAANAALLSGVRADAAASLLKRVYRANREKMPDELSSALSQFKVITEFRNNIVHYGIDPASIPGLVSNRPWAVDLENLNEMVVGKEHIVAATIDAGSIMLILFVFFNDETNPEIIKLVDEQLAQPWRCKPEQLKPAKVGYPQSGSRRIRRQ